MVRFPTPQVANSFIPSPRDSHSASIFSDCLYLFGGSTGAARNDLYEYRFDAQTWREVKPISSDPSSRDVRCPCPRFCHTGVVYNSCLYVFGGYDGQNRLNDFMAFRLADEVNVEIPESSLISDLRNSLLNPKFADITFQMDGGVRKVFFR